MPPVVTDLLQPHGPIVPGMFPDDAPLPAVGPGSLNDRMQVYIDRAVVKVAAYPVGSIADTDLAVRRWALHLAFEGAVTERLSRPMQENSMVPVLGSQGWGSQQITELRRLSEQYRYEFEGMVIAPSETGEANAPTSMYTDTVIRW